MAKANLRVLIIDSDASRQKELESALDEIGIVCTSIRHSSQAWSAFAKHRPTHVFVAMHTQEEDGNTAPAGEQFLRKLNSDYIGTMPRIFITCTAEELATSAPTEPEAFIVWPFMRSALAQLFAGSGFAGDKAGRQATRLRELYDMSLLGPDLIRELDQLISRAALGFQVSDCIIWGPEDEPHWPRTTQQISSAQWPQIRERCEAALQAGTTVMVSLGMGKTWVQSGIGQSLLAAPIGPVGEDPIAGICLLSNDNKVFSPEAVDSLRIVAKRLSKELAWMSAHNRLLAEHEKLRQASLLDPMLGIWTRPALQQAINSQIAATRDRGVPLAIVTFDYTQLRKVNDRHGHLVGDAVLSHFADVISGCLKSQDQLGRVGGDKVAALLVDCPLPQAEERAASILSALGDTCYEDGDIVIEHAAKAGVTVIGEDESGGEAAIVRAQMAIDAGPLKRNSVLVAKKSTVIGLNDVESNDGDLLNAGATLGGMYRILHEISRGSMGVVCRGEDLGLGRPVAIKLLRADLSCDEELVARFRSEAALLASLRHRNLVQVYSFGTEADTVYFVMELVEGEPVSNIVESLARQGSYIEVDAVAKIIEEIAEALDAIHSLGIVHRDVKPDNILVDRINDRAVLVDVGIAKRQGDARDAAGTPGYSAPESFMAADESPPTDVYGLAATAYALLTGSAPYQAERLADVVNQQLHEPPPAPTKVRADLSPAVDSVLLTALAPNPKNRYRTAGAFAIGLGRALTKLPGERRSQAAATIAPAVKARTSPTSKPGTRPSTYRVSVPLTAPATSAGASNGRSRGAIFRVAGLFLQRRMGTEWYRGLLEEAPQLGDLLMPTLSPDSWQRTAHLLKLLDHMEAGSGGSRRIYRELGGHVASATLARLFGADPSAQTPASLLKAAESFWRRYHTWGQLSVSPKGPRATTLTLREGSSHELLCELLAGMFAQMAALAGAGEPECHVDSCMAHGADVCSFTVSWDQ